MVQSDLIKFTLATYSLKLQAMSILFCFSSEVLFITKPLGLPFQDYNVLVVWETQITSLPSNTEICLKEEMDSRDRQMKISLTKLL